MEQRSGKGSVWESELGLWLGSMCLWAASLQGVQEKFLEDRDQPEQFTGRQGGLRGKQRCVTTYPKWVTMRIEGGSKNGFLPHLPTGKGCTNNEAVAVVTISCHQLHHRTSSCVTNGLQENERGRKKLKSS